jgi:hypothetical protein
MNVTNRFAGRYFRAGIVLFSSFVLSGPAKGSEVVITVAGTLNGGNEYLGIFGMGRAMRAGTPYTLVYTFDDTKGQTIGSQACPNSASGISGEGKASPATAVLTIGQKSYMFGRGPNARSKTWRSIASGCSSSEIGIEIMEGQQPLQMGVSTRLAPTQGARSLTQTADWRSALSLSSVYARNTYNHFVITRPNDYAGGTESYLLVSSVTISGPKAPSSAQVPTASR